MERIILYYQFCPIADPEVFRLWQEALCRQLGLRGRIIVSPVGLNGTLGGPLKSLKAYKKAMRTLADFKTMEYKWSAGGAADFPRLSVKVRLEPVTLAADENFDSLDPGRGLTPAEWHRYLEKHPEAVVLDARNDYESQLGSFKAKNLIKPAIKTFKEIKPLVKALSKKEPILTYCTGDIRCEYLSAYMKGIGFEEVYHLKGGIMKYGQKYGDGGFWRGKCYVFDRRMKLGFSPQAADLARCLACSRRTSDQVNCDDCNRQLVVCLACQKEPYRHCQAPTVSSQRRP